MISTRISKNYEDFTRLSTQASYHDLIKDFALIHQDFDLILIWILDFDLISIWFDFDSIWLVFYSISVGFDSISAGFGLISACFEIYELSELSRRSQEVLGSHRKSHLHA